MEVKKKQAEKFSQSITLKAFVVGFMCLILLIPGVMVQNLIRERQHRSVETIDKINAKWSYAQSVCGPILTVPYTVTTTDAKDNLVKVLHHLHITPEDLHIKSQLYPEERYYGIYKTILYKSDNKLTGTFAPVSWRSTDTDAEFHWDRAYLTIGLSDLRGITANIEMDFNGKIYIAEAGGGYNYAVGNQLIIPLEGENDFLQTGLTAFRCQMKLNGSSSINYIALGKTSHVEVNGAWKSPGFVGNFSPEHTITNEGFSAEWNVLRFNRNIPEMWFDDKYPALQEASFGINLVDPVDHYQQNMRSSKYDLMFIALTFVVFFFVELLTHKKVHPIQYLLVGIALILFYSLLLSISEQIGFGWAYLISSTATIGLIASYAQTIFKNKLQTAILTFILAGLYLFLYVILQLEDIALLIGSIGLFVILAVIMYFSRKIQWYKPQHELTEPATESELALKV